MALEEVIVRRRYRVACDCCGVGIRGRRTASKVVIFELVSRRSEIDESPAVYRFRDLCKGCAKRLVKVAVRIEKMYGSRKREEETK